MKKFIFPFIVLFSLFMSVGCSTKFNIGAPYKNITVVYAFLDEADTAHYIRIEKAFLDQSKSAITMAQSADSSYNSNISVRIERYSYPISGTWFDTIHLNKVDLTAEGYPKQPGVFFTAPNYAYKFTNTLDPNYMYRIKVTNFSTGEIDSADAPIIDDKNSSAFNVDILDDSNLNRAGLDFSEASSSRSFELNCTYSPVPNFSFEGFASPAYISEAIVQFNWVDSNTLTKSKTRNSYSFNAGYIGFNGTTATYQIPNTAFYSAILSGMGAAPANIVRLIDRCQFYVYASTYDFYLYQQSSSTQGTGLTGSEIEPIATNVKGANALGLYTSRGTRTGLITITLTTIDSLQANPLTQPVNIVGTAY